MVNSLGESQQTGSTVLARRAIELVGDHVGSLADLAARVATGFDGYVETYQVRNRVPEPLPFAEQLDAVREHSPGVLAQLPGLAQLEEEHNARTAEARELYRRLDLADATPAFPLMSTPLTTGQAGTVFTAPAGPRPCGRAPGPAARLSGASTR